MSALSPARKRIVIVSLVVAVLCMIGAIIAGSWDRQERARSLRESQQKLDRLHSQLDEMQKQIQTLQKQVEKTKNTGR
jgi:peptidoglycan hydrolase CwlO-like protein